MPIRDDVVYSVYQYIDIVGKSYIGLTNDCCRRKNEHRLAKGNSLFHVVLCVNGMVLKPEMVNIN